MKNKETFLITGASGFIGGWIAEILYFEGLDDVRAGIRSWSGAARLARFPLNIVLCDVMDKAQISQAMAGVDTIIHCATGSRDVIIQGTENMLEIALAKGIKRFVHLSTTEVYGNASGEIDERYPYQYTGDEYGDSKIEAEKLCRRYYGRGLPITIIRPSIVYGPFSKDWTVRLTRKLQSGNWGLFEGNGEGFCNLIYINDLVAGILLAARQKRAIGEVYNLNGNEIITWNQYFLRFNAALGLPNLSVMSPAKSKINAALMEPVRTSAKFIVKQLESPLKKMYERFRYIRTLMQYAEKSIKTIPKLDELSLYNRQAIYVAKMAREKLGFKPKFDVSFGIQMNVHWLQHSGLVDRQTI
jgi:nucleoside-diphosphate-sugar epimerase